MFISANLILALRDLLICTTPSPVHSFSMEVALVHSELLQWAYSKFHGVTALVVVPPEYNHSKQGYHARDWTFPVGGWMHQGLFFTIPILLSMKSVHLS